MYPSRPWSIPTTKINLNTISKPTNEIEITIRCFAFSFTLKKAVVNPVGIAIIPEITTTRLNGYKAVNYEKIIPLLIEAIKDNRVEINKLKELNKL